MGENESSGSGQVSKEASDSPEKNSGNESGEEYSLEARVESSDRTDSKGEKYSVSPVRHFSAYSRSASKAKHAKSAGYSGAKASQYSKESGSSNEEGMEAKASQSVPEIKGKTSVPKDGSVLIIEYKDEKTGDVQYLLEENDSDYAIPVYRHKLRFIGGSVEHSDSNKLEALVREITEEIADKKAQDILIRHIRQSGKKIGTIVDHIGKYRPETDVYKITISSQSDWETITRSRFSHDAGYQRIISKAEAATMPEENFAFGHGHILKGVVLNSGHWHEASHYSLNSLNSNGIASNPAANKLRTGFERAEKTAEFKPYVPVSSLYFRAA